MEVRRKGYGVGSTIFLVGGVWILITARPDSVRNVLTLAFAPFAVAAGAWLTFQRVRPFRFHIGPQGLTLRTRGINRLVRWSEIRAVVLTGDIQVRNGRSRMSTRLLLVPASSEFEAKLDQPSPVDARPCLEILDFEDVKEEPADVAEALSRFGGQRFVDARAALAQAVNLASPVSPVTIPNFTITLRGYDRAAVDALIMFAQFAIGDHNGMSRMEAREQLETSIAKGLPTALRGYDRAQVDTALKRFSERLVRWEEPRPPS